MAAPLLINLLATKMSPTESAHDVAPGEMRCHKQVGINQAALHCVLFERCQRLRPMRVFGVHVCKSLGGDSSPLFRRQARAD